MARELLQNSKLDMDLTSTKSPSSTDHRCMPVDRDCYQLSTLAPVQYTSASRDEVRESPARVLYLTVENDDVREKKNLFIIFALLVYWSLSILNDHEQNRPL